MSLSRIHSVTAVAMGISMGGSALAATETQTFDTAASASAAGWTEFQSRQTDAATPNNFGFSNTANATNPDAPGEAGGTFYRGADASETPAAVSGGGRAYYADTAIGDMNIETPLAFTCSWNSTNRATELYIGYFNTNRSSPVQTGDGFGNSLGNFLGFRIDDTRAYANAIPALGTPPGSMSTDDDEVPLIGATTENIVHTLSWSFAPNAGSGSSGTITASLDGGTPVQLLSSFPDTDFPLSFNAFGLHNKGGPQQGPQTVFFDNITYTSAAAGVAGDFNSDAVVNATDIDLLCDRINAGTGPISPFDVNSDGSVNQADVNFEVTSILDTKFGDTDTDGDVDLNDLGNLASGFGQPGEKRWSKGNFDCDQDVDLNDLGTLATNFGAGRAAAFAEFQALVPEPAAAGTLIFAFVPGILRRRRR